MAEGSGTLASSWHPPLIGGSSRGASDAKRVLAETAKRFQGGNSDGYAPSRYGPLNYPVQSSPPLILLIGLMSYGNMTVVVS